MVGNLNCNHLRANGSLLFFQGLHSNRFFSQDFRFCPHAGPPWPRCKPPDSSVLHACVPFPQGRDLGLPCLVLDLFMCFYWLQNSMDQSKESSKLSGNKVEQTCEALPSSGFGKSSTLPTLKPSTVQDQSCQGACCRQALALTERVSESTTLDSNEKDTISEGCVLRWKMAAQSGCPSFRLVTSCCRGMRRTAIPRSQKSPLWSRNLQDI